MAIPDFQTLMLPVLRSAAGGEIRISDTVERLAAEFALSPEERSHLLPSGTQTTFSNRVHRAKSHLGKAGLVELTKRGTFPHHRSGTRGSCHASGTHRHQALVGGSGDGGVDGIIDQDHLGLDRIYVQAKRHA